MADTEVFEELDSVKVVRWRRDELFRAGYEWREAKALARCPDVDLHRAVALMKRIGNSRLAARILL